MRVWTAVETFGRVLIVVGRQLVDAGASMQLNGYDLVEGSRTVRELIRDAAHTPKRARTDRKEHE